MNVCDCNDCKNMDLDGISFIEFEPNTIFNNPLDFDVDFISYCIECCIETNNNYPPTKPLFLIDDVENIEIAEEYLNI